MRFERKGFWQRCLAAAVAVIGLGPTRLVGDDKVSDVLAADQAVFRVESAKFQLADSDEEHIVGVEGRETLRRIIKVLTLDPGPSPPGFLPVPFLDDIEIHGALGSRKVSLNLSVASRRNCLRDAVAFGFYDVRPSEIDAFRKL